MEAAIIPLHPPHDHLFPPVADKGTTLPLFAATVQAGFPSPALDYSSEPIDLNTYAIRHPASTFLVKVVNDSMIGAHIMPGDLALVDKAIRAISGMIVLAWVDGDFTIKRLRLEGDAAYLDPENDKYQSIRIDSPERGMIWGVVVAIHRAIFRP